MNGGETIGVKGRRIGVGGEKKEEGGREGGNTREAAVRRDDEASQTEG